MTKIIDSSNDLSCIHMRELMYLLNFGSISVMKAVAISNHNWKKDRMKNYKTRIKTENCEDYFKNVTLFLWWKSEI